MSDWVYEKWREMKGFKEKKASGEEFRKIYMLGEWPVNDAVYSREEVARMVDRGEISDKRSDELLRLRWDTNCKGEKVQVEDRG